MTRKLGRLLVVALVVAAVAVPMSVASADIGEHLECHGIIYDPTNPDHLMYPELSIEVREYFDMWEVWNYRHHGDTVPTDLDRYIVFDMGDHVSGPPAGGAYVFFWNDLVWDDSSIDSSWHVRIEGTIYNDIICGGPEDDVILSRAGADIVYGGSFVPSAGNDDEDVILGGPGSDILMGGWGYDAVSGRGGADMVYGGFPEDLYPGEDEMGPYPYANDNPPDQNEVYGGPGDDHIFPGTTGNDYLYGVGGNDVIDASGGDGVWAVGGPGNDTIIGGIFENDGLMGGPGDDQIWGMGGDDWINGNDGNDILYVLKPGEYGTTFLVDPLTVDGTELYGGRGDDQLWGALGQEEALWGEAGNDTIVVGGPVTIGATAYLGDGCLLGDCKGGSGADTMTGSGSADFLDGQGGDDTLIGGKGMDTLNAGLGDDLVYGGDDADYILGGAGHDDLFGDAGDDDIFGDDVVAAATDGADWIAGGDGSDELIGGKGADVLYGDAGNDFLTGGPWLGDWTTSNPDAAVDDMYGGLGGDTYSGAVADLDKATELTNPAAEIDTANHVPGLFLFASYFEVVVLP